VILPFNQALASQSPEDFIQDVLISGLGAKYVLVGDDFRFGAKRAGDYAMLDAAGQALGFDVARMNSYEVHGLRVSSTAVREALAAGDMQQAAKLLGHPTASRAMWCMAASWAASWPNPKAEPRTAFAR
jgi:riboflavin kinase/FMN adenylyltransferase